LVKIREEKRHKSMCEKRLIKNTKRKYFHMKKSNPNLMLDRDLKHLWMLQISCHKDAKSTQQMLPPIHLLDIFEKFSTCNIGKVKYENCQQCGKFMTLLTQRSHTHTLTHTSTHLCRKVCYKFQINMQAKKKKNQIC